MPVFQQSGSPAHRPLRRGTARPTRPVAVVGAGVAGLTAAYELRRAEAEVVLVEADDRLGGHAHTQSVPGPDGRELALDTGFLVHNERTYPHLVALFRELGVCTQDSEMGMSVHCDGCGLEYAGARGPAGLLAQPSAVLRRRYLAMLADVPRLHRRARALPGGSFADCPEADMTARRPIGRPFE